jgi:hypothetical protein
MEKNEKTLNPSNILYSAAEARGASRHSRKIAGEPCNGLGGAVAQRSMGGARRVPS